MSLPDQFQGEVSPLIAVSAFVNGRRYEQLWRAPQVKPGWPLYG